MNHNQVQHKDNRTMTISEQIITLHAQISLKLDRPDHLTIVNPIICDAVDYDGYFQLVHNDAEQWLLNFNINGNYEPEAGTLDDLLQLFIDHCNNF